jgi:hypothetical protein
MFWIDALDHTGEFAEGPSFEEVGGKPLGGYACAHANAEGLEHFL